jgi:hypothetical protein
MKKSESITKLAAAIVKAQPEIEKAFKKSENPFFHSTYADLTEVWRSCEKSLKTNKLAILQPMSVNENNEVLVETILMHESGEWISGEILVKPEKQTPQGMGSAITYSRRYSLAAMVGICPEDDDAEAAMNRNGKSEKPQYEKKPTKSGLLDEIIETMKKLDDPKLKEEDNHAYKMRVMESSFGKKTWKEVQGLKNKELTIGLNLLKEILKMKSEAEGMPKAQESPAPEREE